MFNREIISGSSPFENLQQYYLAESRAIGSVFGDAIDDIVRQVRYYTEHATEFNPVLRNNIDFDTSKRSFYTGWQFDAEHNVVAYIDTPIAEFHMIYVKYHFHRSYNSACDIDEREDYSNLNDSIILNVDIPYVQENKISDKELRSSIVHEFAHSLQMWVDSPGRMNDKSTAYRNFINYDYLNSKGINSNFIDKHHLGHIQNALTVLSDVETEAMCEEIEEYVRLNGKLKAMSTDYMTSETYIEDFFKICSDHIFVLFKKASNMLSVCRKIVNGSDYHTVQFKTLVLFASILVDMKFINDTYHKEYADYKQCKRIQNNDFALNYELTQKLIESLDFLAKKLDDFVYNAQKEIRNACKKYKINEVLEKEDVTRLIESKWVKNYPKIIYESKSPYLQEKRYEYQDYRELLDYGRNMEQIEYLTESIRLLFLNLFDETPMQCYGHTFGPCITKPVKVEGEKFMTTKDLQKILESCGYTED